MNHSSSLVANNSIILVDKPAGMSSFGVVARIRRALSDQAGFVSVTGKDGVTRQKRKKVKVGHTGTLDPFATGLLIILTGDQTKRANAFLKLDKEYLATIRLGATSTTGDLEGKITPYQLPTQIPQLSDIERILPQFLGEIQQRVPNFSAVKINGERAYKLARAGKPIEMPVRPVHIYELEILDYTWPDLQIRCKVSSGTYIRTLGEDIGQALGVGGYLTALRRTRVGNYRIESATPLSTLVPNV